MSSENRSFSAVSNLRLKFEKNDSDVDASIGATRGRSIGSITSERSRQTSTVRANFVSVEPTMSQTDNQEQTTADDKSGSLTAVEGETAPVGQAQKDGFAGDMNKTVSQEHEQKQQEVNVASATPAAAEDTHATSAVGQFDPDRDDKPASLEDNAAKLIHAGPSPGAERPQVDGAIEPTTGVDDKPSTGVGSEKTASGSADVTGETPSRIGDVLPTVSEGSEPTTKTTEDIDANANHDAENVANAEQRQQSPRHAIAEESTPTPVHRMSTEQPMETKTQVHVETSPSNPGTQTSPPAESPSFSAKEVSSSRLSAKPSRGSLTAPTAASLARADREKSHHINGTSTAKPKPRAATKPLDIPVRLTAPTAASKARLDDPQQDGFVKTNGKTAVKPGSHLASLKPTPRHSLPALGTPASRRSSGAQKPVSAKKSAPVPDSSFLERMTRPTAASASKAHDKVEVKGTSKREAISINKHANKPPSAPNATSTPQSSTLKTSAETASKATDPPTQSPGDVQHDADAYSPAITST